MGLVLIVWQCPWCVWPESRSPGSVVDLEEGVFQGGLCPLVLLQEMPSLTSTAHLGTHTTDDNGAALVEGVCLTAGKQDANVVWVSSGEVWCNILHVDELGSPGFC